ncbi:MAG: phosphate ABC transporter substrate-binding protein, partial [Burkholderiaceae bacterium]
MAVKNLLLSSLFAIGISLAYNGIAQVVVVAGVNSPIAPLTREQVAALFLGKSFVLPSGGIPVLVDQLETADTRKQFYSQVTEKSPAQVKAAW